MEVGGSCLLCSLGWKALCDVIRKFGAEGCDCDGVFERKQFERKKVFYIISGCMRKTLTKLPAKYLEQTTCRRPDEQTRLTNLFVPAEQVVQL